MHGLFSKQGLFRKYGLSTQRGLSSKLGDAPELVGRLAFGFRSFVRRWVKSSNDFFTTFTTARVKNAVAVPTSYEPCTRIPMINMYRLTFRGQASQFKRGGPKIAARVTHTSGDVTGYTKTQSNCRKFAIFGHSLGWKHLNPNGTKPGSTQYAPFCTDSVAPWDPYAPELVPMRLRWLANT